MNKAVFADCYYLVCPDYRPHRVNYEAAFVLGKPYLNVRRYYYGSTVIFFPSMAK